MISFTIKKRKGRKHYSTWIDGKYVSTGQADQRLAMQVAAQIHAVGVEAYRQGKRTLSENLVDLIEAYVDHLRVVDRRNAEHIRKKRMQLSKPVEDGVFTRLREVRKQTFEPWWSALPCGPKTRNEYLTAWNVFLDWLVYENHLNENPIRNRVRRARVREQDRTTRRAFTVDELQRLLVVAGPHRFLYEVAASTGARKNELKQLLWTDVHEHFSTPCITLRPETTKNGKGRTLFLPADLTQAFRENREDAVSGSVFNSLPNHHTFDRHLSLARIEKETGEGRVSFHCLRHTFTTLIARITGDARLAQRMADHADIKTTQGYMHTEAVEHAEVMRRFPSLRATGRASGVVQTGQIVSNTDPTGPKENGTQVPVTGSLGTVLSPSVQGSLEMEPGESNPREIDCFRCNSGGAHRNAHRRSARCGSVAVGRNLANTFA